jgi:hypothetical protein
MILTVLTPKLKSPSDGRLLNIRNSAGADKESIIARIRKASSLPHLSRSSPYFLPTEILIIHSFIMKTALSLLAALMNCTAAYLVYHTLSIISSRSLETCPPNSNLPPIYLSPTLMVPVSKNLPDVAFGGTKIPLITPNDFCTIFNLVIPPSAAGGICTLEFLFPNH